MKTFTKDDILWYEKEVEIPKNWEGKHVLINFGAVDWNCEVFINKNKVGQHTGGYSYFYFDIIGFLKEGKNTILLKVRDVADTVYFDWGKYQPVGKKTIKPNSIWYSPSSSIWQTAWLEPVNEYYIEKLEINNDYDNREIKVTFKVDKNVKLPIEFSAKFNNKLVGGSKRKSNEEISINILNIFMIIISNFVIFKFK